MPRQGDALDLFDSIANESRFHVDMDFEPGDMQFLKNAVILHAGTQYEDWDEPECWRSRANCDGGE